MDVLPGRHYNTDWFGIQIILILPMTTFLYNREIYESTA